MNPKYETVKVPTIPAPSHLSEKARAVWLVLTGEFALAPPVLALLSQTLDAFDRAEQAAALVRVEGLVTKDRWGQIKSHPAVAIERDSRGVLVRCVKALIQALQHFPRLSDGGFQTVAVAFGATLAAVDIEADQAGGETAEGTDPNGDRADGGPGAAVDQENRDPATVGEVSHKADGSEVAIPLDISDVSVIIESMDICKTTGVDP